MIYFCSMGVSHARLAFPALPRLFSRWGYGFLSLTITLMAGLPSARATPLSLSEVAPGIYVHQGVNEDAAPSNQGDIANIGFIIGEETVAVIDTGGTYKLGQRLLAALRQISDLPVRYVINTHIHPDHIFGNAAFSGENPTYVGHVNLGPSMKNTQPYYIPQLRRTLGEEETAGSIMVPPSLNVEIGMPVELDLGERLLTLQAWPIHHSPTDLTIYDQKTSTLWAGSVFVERIPSITGSLLGYIDVLEEMKTIDAALVIPGNGPAPAPWPEAAKPMLRYFRILATEIREILSRGGTIEEAVATVGRSETDHWLLFDAYNGGNVTAAFAELEWEE